MAFSHRIATLAAVVAIPLGIAATSYALTDAPAPPKPPAKVDLRSPATPSRSPDSPGTSGDQVVPRPSATDDADDLDDGGDGPDDGDD